MTPAGRAAWRCMAHFGVDRLSLLSCFMNITPCTPGAVFICGLSCARSVDTGNYMLQITAVVDLAVGLNPVISR